MTVDVGERSLFVVELLPEPQLEWMSESQEGEDHNLNGFYCCEYFYRCGRSDWQRWETTIHTEASRVISYVIP